MTQWAVDLAVKYCVENVDMLLRKSEESGFNTARWRWKDFRDERASVGDGIHSTIEAEHTNSWAYPKLNDEQEAIMAQWRQLNEEHSIEPILTEFTVADETVGYMGTADGYWKIDGVRCLIDVKTSRKTWPEHGYQLGALWHAPEWLIEVDEMKWESQKPQEIEKVALIHLRSDLHEIIYLDNMKENFDAFAGYKQVWEAKQKIKTEEKKKYGEF